eukprot:3989461-Pleurochrysis_carterae.AAC.1
MRLSGDQKARSTTALSCALKSLNAYLRLARMQRGSSEHATVARFQPELHAMRNSATRKLTKSESFHLRGAGCWSRPICPTNEAGA